MAQYTGAGILFGVVFPVIAFVIRGFQGGVAGAMASFQSDPLIWIILTAPIFLGMAAFLIGKKQCALHGFIEKLEHRVEERTRKIRTILDHVKTGFLICDREGQVLPGYTKSCLSIFKKEKLEGEAFAWLLNLDKKDLAGYEMMYFQAMDGMLPAEGFLAQMPEQFRVGDRVYYFKGAALPFDAEHEKSILFTIVDITDQEQAKLESIRNYHLVQILRFKDGFMSFLRETKTLLGRCRKSIIREHEDNLRADLHAIKGNVGSYGFSQLARYVHQVEDKEQILSQHIDEIEMQVNAYLDQNFDTLGISWAESESRDVVLDSASLHKLQESARQSNRLEMLQAQVQQFVTEARYIRAGCLLSPYKSLVARLAKEFDKPVEFLLTGGEIKVDDHIVGPVFNNITHLIRNSMDHGIETAAARGQKNPVGRISIQLANQATGWEIRYQDDGKGIDVDQLIRRAVGKKLLDDEKAGILSENERLQLIFHPGFSTAQTATMTSGRGMGMFGLKQAVEESGGTIEVETVIGEGTSFIITVPVDQATAPASQVS